MEQTQLLTLILTSSVVGGVVTKLFDVARDWLAGHLKKRRAEVDVAIRARDKAIAERDAARSEADWHDRHADILDESLRVHRRLMIDAPCIDPDAIPPYPARPSKEKS